MTGTGGSGAVMLRGLVIDVGLPVAAYYVLRAFGVSDWVALLAATGVAAARLAWGILACRALNPFAVIMLAVYGTGLVLGLLTGDPRVLLVKNSLITAAVGLVFLGTAIHGRRPLTLSAAQSFNPARAGELATNYATIPVVRRAFLTSSYVWSAGLLAEALLRLPIVYLLPIDIGYAVSEALLVAVVVLLGAWTMRTMRRAANTNTGEKAG